MNGIQAITAQIIADAQTEADRILAQARARAKECLSAYQEQAYIQSTALLERSERESALREERLSHAAILAARNLRLSTEQEMRERAFAAALKQLSELPDGEYVGLLAGLAAEASSTGREEVILSQKDRARYGKGGTPVNERPGDGLSTRLSRPGSIRGGLILILRDGKELHLATLVAPSWGEMDRTAVEVFIERLSETGARSEDTHYLTIPRPACGM